MTKKDKEDKKDKKDKKGKKRQKGQKGQKRTKKTKKTKVRTQRTKIWTTSEVALYIYLLGFKKPYSLARACNYIVSRIVFIFDLSIVEFLPTHYGRLRHAARERVASG